MKILHKPLMLIILFIFPIYKSSAQTTYNDGLIVYSISVAGSSDPKYTQYFKDATMKFYIRGMHSRAEMQTSLGSTITIHDNQTGNVVVLNEYGDQKIMVKMNAAQYKEANKRYINPAIELQKDQKVINGYNCILAKVKFQDGKIFSVYYAPDLKFSNEFNGLSVSLNGFPLEYESEVGGIKVLYKASKISTESVSAKLFDIPSSGYREMKYEEMPRQ